MWLQASFSVAQAVVALADISSAVGFITLAQFMGITIALSIANTIFMNNSQTKISEILPNFPISEIQAAMQGAQNGFVQSLSPELKAQVVNVIVESISKTYVLVIAAGSTVAVLSLLMMRERLFTSTPIGAA